MVHATGNAQVRDPGMVGAMTGWKGERPIVAHTRDEFNIMGYTGWVTDSGSWYIFGKLADMDCMINGQAGNLDAGRRAVEHAISRLRDYKMVPR